MNDEISTTADRDVATRRKLIVGAVMAAVGIAMVPAEALAQGRGWGPDGMGPPGQRRRRGGWIPPGHRRRRWRRWRRGW